MPQTITKQQREYARKNGGSCPDCGKEMTLNLKPVPWFTCCYCGTVQDLIDRLSKLDQPDFQVILTQHENSTKTFPIFSLQAVHRNPGSKPTKIEIRTFGLTLPFPDCEGLTLEQALGIVKNQNKDTSKLD